MLTSPLRHHATGTHRENGSVVHKRTMVENNGKGISHPLKHARLAVVAPCINGVCAHLTSQTTCNMPGFDSPLLLTMVLFKSWL